MQCFAQAFVSASLSTEREFSLDVEFSAESWIHYPVRTLGRREKLQSLIAWPGWPLQMRDEFPLANAYYSTANIPIQVPVAKRGVGYVLQDLALFPHLTVEQNIEYGLAHLPRSARKQRATAMLQEFRIDHLRPATPSENLRRRTPASGVWPELW